MIKDAKTGFEIREMDLENKKDIKLFIQANKNIALELLKYTLMKDDLRYGKSWLFYEEIGLGMRSDYCSKKERGYVVLKDGEAIGTGWVAEVNYPRYYYPFVYGCEIGEWTELSVKILMAIARMIKTQGHQKIYSQIVKNHPINQFIPLKDKLGEFPLDGNRKPIMESWELNVS